MNHCAAAADLALKAIDYLEAQAEMASPADAGLIRHAAHEAKNVIVGLGLIAHGSTVARSEPQREPER